VQLWQAFVGTGTRRIENYYNELLMLGGDEGSDKTKAGGLLSSTTNNAIVETGVAEKWKSQIEKVT
jgi:hypothetical protein